jgi:hypothetical protein
MPRVVPSQVVAFIDQTFPWLKSPGAGAVLAKAHAGEARGLIELVDRIPDELLTLSGNHYSEFVSSVAAIRHALGAWQNQQNPNIETNLGIIVRNLNPVTVIRQALATCPDENPSSATAELQFISDAELQDSLRIDIGAINRALSNSEWKSATVLAGSVIEALLLWAVQRRQPTELTAAINALIPSGLLSRQPDSNLESWDLHEYTEVSARLGIIKKDTADQVRLARRFRNLIHPGRAIRLAQKCDRATALSAVAGVEHVVRDLAQAASFTSLHP